MLRMKEPTNFRQKCCECHLRPTPRYVRFFSNICGFTPWVRRLVREEMKSERERLAGEEAELWASAFGGAAPANGKAKREAIIRIASAKALLANINNRSSA